MRIRYPGRWSGYVAQCDGTPPSEYPLGVDLATAARWLWRVRRWRYDLSANLSQGGTVTWTHSDSANPPPTVQSGSAQVQASASCSLTVPSPATDPRADESALLAQNAGLDGGWGKQYEAVAGFDANLAGQRDATHADPTLTASTSYPFANPGRVLSAHYQVIGLWQDAYFPYPSEPPGEPNPVMYYSTGKGLYYPRLLLFAQATAVAGGTVPADGADQGVAVAVATRGALAATLPGFAAPLGSLLSNWQAASGGGVVGDYKAQAQISVQIDGLALSSDQLATAGFGMAAAVSTVTHSAGGTVADTHAGTFNAPVLSLSLSVSPAEYWPYTDQAGNALYDAATGAVVLGGAGGGLANPVLAPYP